MKQGSPGAIAESTFYIGLTILIQWSALAAMLYGIYGNHSGFLGGLGWGIAGALVASASVIFMAVTSALTRPWRRRPIERLIFWLQMPTGIPVLYYTVWCGWRWFFG